MSAFELPPLNIPSSPGRGKANPPPS